MSSVFPGTVITTGNIPTMVSVDVEYNMFVGRFLGIASSVSLGKGAAEPMHGGAFVFADSSESSGPFAAARANSFNVRATGGVRFVTGYTKGGRELGVVLDPGSSAWAVLSDEASKVILAPVDHEHTLHTLATAIPVSAWSYQGDRVRHIGPMAQDVYEAFGLGESPERLSSIDVDGIALSAAKGMDAVVERSERRVAALQRQLSDSARAQEEGAAAGSRLDALVWGNEELLSRLGGMLGLRSS